MLDYKYYNTFLGVTTMEAKTFYYRFHKFDTLLVLNILLAVLLAQCLACFPSMIYWPQVRILIVLATTSSFVWCWLHLVKHKMAVIDDRGITIDHCQLLACQDIKNAEEKIVRCCFKKRRVLILNPKEGIEYRYNFLQKHNGEFTAFSIPLYGIISQKDAEEITAIIASKVKLTKLKENP